MDSVEQKREECLDEASAVIKAELEEQAIAVLNLRKEVSLAPTAILSDEIVRVSTVPDRIKRKIAQTSENLRDMISGVAYFVQEEKITELDEMVAAYNGDLRHRERMQRFFSSRKKMMISYSSISTVIDIFKRVNQGILEEFAKAEIGDEPAKKKAELHIKNAILVYEITNFVIGYLSDFDGLNGVQDFKAVQREVMKEVGDARDNIKELMRSNSAVVDSVRAQKREGQEARLNALTMVEKKWKEISGEISGQEAKIKKVSSLLSSLKYIRDDAKSQIEVVGIVAATSGVDDAITKIGELTEEMLSFELKPLDEDTVMSLLQIR